MLINRADNKRREGTPLGQHVFVVLGNVGYISGCLMTKTKVYTSHFVNWCLSIKTLVLSFRFHLLQTNPSSVKKQVTIITGEQISTITVYVTISSIVSYSITVQFKKMPLSFHLKVWNWSNFYIYPINSAEDARSITVWHLCFSGWIHILLIVQHGNILRVRGFVRDG